MTNFAYPCVGGPLNGEYATPEDFFPEVVAKRATAGYKEGDVLREGGMYGHLSKEYYEFNQARRMVSKRLGSFPPSMIFVHTSVLKPLARPKDR